MKTTLNKTDFFFIVGRYLNLLATDLALDIYNKNNNQQILNWDALFGEKENNVHRKKKYQYKTLVNKATAANRECFDLPF